MSEYNYKKDHKTNLLIPAVEDAKDPTVEYNKLCHEYYCINIMCHRCVIGRCVEEITSGDNATYTVEEIKKMVEGE